MFPKLEDTFERCGDSQEPPKLEDMFPKLEDRFPKLEDWFPKLEDEFPKLEDTPPKLEDMFPKLEDVTRDLNLKPLTRRRYYPQTPYQGFARQLK